MKRDWEEDVSMVVNLNVSFDELDAVLAAETYILPLVHWQISHQDPLTLYNVIGGIILKGQPQHILKYQRIGAFDTAINDSWSIKNKGAKISHERMMCYYRDHAGWKQVVEII